MMVNNITLCLKWQKEIPITKIPETKNDVLKKSKCLLISYYIYTVSFYMYLFHKQ